MPSNLLPPLRTRSGLQPAESEVHVLHVEARGAPHGDAGWARRRWLVVVEGLGRGLVLLQPLRHGDNVVLVDGLLQQARR